MSQSRPRRRAIDANDDEWELARAREAVIRPIVMSPPLRGAATETVQAAAAELGISVQWIYKLIKAYRADSRTQSLLPEKRGAPKGRSRLSREMEDLIELAINETYLVRTKPKKTALYREIFARCHKLNLPRPGTATIDARLARISKREQVKKRQGSKAARDAFDPIRGSLEAERPLQIIQIDHTRVDVNGIEKTTAEVIGRPWVTVAIDVRTRVYYGYYLTFDAPSARSVAACLTHAVLEKTPWLMARKLPDRWPVYGLCEIIHVDNGKEFHSKAFTRACENYGIEVRYRPRRTPHMGGHVERRLGHLSQELHLLDGTTFSNIAERGAYNSEGEACLTLDEIEWMIGSIILEHQVSFHEGIGTTPLQKWTEETKGRVFRMPPDAKEFYREFLPSETRLVQRDGIHLNGIRYWHDALVPFLHAKEKVEVHFDPTDLAKVFVRGKSNDYLEVPYRDLRRPSITLWEHRAAKRALRRRGKKAVDETLIFEMVDERRKAMKEARSRSKLARREIVKSGLEMRSAPYIVDEEPLVIEGRSSEADSNQLVELPYYETEEWDD